MICNIPPHFDLDRRWLHPMQNPLALGTEVVVNSATKYLGGPGDLTAGAAILNDAELALHVRLHRLKDMTWVVMSALDAHLVMRGLKTLALCMGRHCDDAKTLVQHMAGMTHSTYTPEERQRHHIGDGLVRRSAGLEDIDDLAAEISQALGHAAAAGRTLKRAA